MSNWLFVWQSFKLFKFYKLSYKTNYYYCIQHLLFSHWSVVLKNKSGLLIVLIYEPESSITFIVRCFNLSNILLRNKYERIFSLRGWMGWNWKPTDKVMRLMGSLRPYLKLSVRRSTIIKGVIQLTNEWFLLTVTDVSIWEFCFSYFLP